MGCLSSKDASILKAKKWKSQEPVTLEELQKRREEFWDTAPHYGGDPGKLSCKELKECSSSSSSSSKFLTLKLLIVLPFFYTHGSYLGGTQSGCSRLRERQGDT